jgi:hypothetical protein
MKEQIFFKDPAVDRVMGVVMQLASEVYILKDRNRALEKLLEEKGIVAPEAIENSLEKISAEEREEFIARIFEPVLQGDAASSNVDEEFQLS